jgi:hypothetical protein
MIPLTSDRDDLHIPCIQEIIKLLTEYTKLMKQIFPMYHAFRHAIMISLPKSKYDSLIVHS